MGEGDGEGPVCLLMSQAHEASSVVYSLFNAHNNILKNYCPHFTDGNAEVQMGKCDQSNVTGLKHSTAEIGT